MKVIPSINVGSFEEVKKRIELLKSITKEFHLDISSLNFTNHQTWQNPKDLERLDENLKLQIHLMVKLKPQEILKWNNKRIKSLILHFEGCNLPFALLKFAKKLKKEIIIAWSPSVEKEFIEEFLQYVNGILILSVYPGKSGQKFIESSFNRLEDAISFKNKFRNIKNIIIDGGINEENFKDLVNYKNLDYIIIGYAIFGKDDPVQAYKYFLSLT